jgi:hypothetical protein
MRKVILILLVLVAFKSSQAQQTNTPIHTTILIIPDTSKVVNSFTNNNRFKTATDSMPNPLNGKEKQLIKDGTNNNGPEMYQSKHDNKIVLKPDTLNVVSTYIPNVYEFAGKKFILSPKTNLLMATISEFKITTHEATNPIIK